MSRILSNSLVRALAILSMLSTAGSVSRSTVELRDAERGYDIASQDLARGYIFLYDIRALAPDSYASEDFLGNYRAASCSGSIGLDCPDLDRLDDQEGLQRCLEAEYSGARILLGHHDNTVGRAVPSYAACRLNDGQSVEFILDVIIDSPSTHSVAYYHGFNIRMLQELLESEGRLTEP